MGLENNKIYSTLIFKELESFSQKNNIAFWLSKDIFKNADEAPYYQCDMHINEYGHELIAKFLFDNIIENEDILNE